jgi:small subunit ribosomal protein S16
MLAIKLQRIGKKHQPSYRLVVAPARSKMAGPPVEDLGSYHPKTKAIAVKKDRVSYWLGVGAQPTVTVHNLLVAQGVVTTPKLAVKMKKVVVAEAPVEAAPKAEAVAAKAGEAPAQDEVANVEVTPDEAAPAEATEPAA